jgi:general secretion pathway protein C
MLDCGEEDGGMVEARHPENLEIAGSGKPGSYSLVGKFVLGGLVALLAVQTARLTWLLLMSAGPLGAPKFTSAANPLQLDGFDPFFRLQAASSSSAVTSLPLKLFGTRRDSATGLGSAIIATPDGIQSSYAVGEDIMPGVILAGVGSDEVTIERGGAKEKLFLDQSVPAPVVQPATITGASSSTITRLPKPSVTPAAPILQEQLEPPMTQTLEQK